MNPDAGNDYVAGLNTRQIWNLSDLARDTAIIATEPHGNRVNFYCIDPDRNAAATGIAHEAGHTGLARVPDMCGRARSKTRS
jgi:hypothetical protein